MKLIHLWNDNRSGGVARRDSPAGNHSATAGHSAVNRPIQSLVVLNTSLFGRPRLSWSHRSRCSWKPKLSKMLFLYFYRYTVYYLHHRNECKLASEFKQYVSQLCMSDGLGRKQELKPLLCLRCTSVFDAILCHNQSLISGQGKTHVSLFW